MCREALGGTCFPKWLPHIFPPRGGMWGYGVVWLAFLIVVLFIGFALVWGLLAA